MILLLAGLALAAPLTLAPSPGAVTDVLPVMVPGRVDIVFHGNSEDLRPQIGTGTIDGVRSWRLLDMGGVWLLSLAMRDPTTTVAFNPTGTTLTAAITPIHPPPPPAPRRRGRAAPTPESAMCDATPLTPLEPLHGRDMLSDLLPSIVTPELPRWSEAEPTDATWGKVDRLRRTLDPTDAKQYYQLGALHRDLGQAREAEYYFTAAGRLGAPPATAVLQRAGAQLAVQDWAGAASSASEARALGADEALLLRIEGIAKWMTPSEDPVAAGRALASTASSGAAALVAGELLLRGGCPAEAEAVLARSIHDSDGQVAAMSLRLLMDARILLGDLPGADAALQELTTSPEAQHWVPLLRSRSSLLNMLKQPPDAWAPMVPMLERVGRGEGDDANESLYLLGQVSEVLGDPRLAIYAWTTLADRDRRFMTGDPGLRLMRAWQSRVQTLLAEGKDLDALSVHDGLWRPGLAAHMVDPTPLYELAAAAGRLSMYEPALDLMRTASEIEGEHALDDRASILTIARLYRLSGRTPEAIQSLDVLASRPPDPVITAGLTLERAAIQEEAGDDDGAVALYNTVGSPPAEAAEAAVRRAMIDARDGRCDAALLVFGAPPDPFPAGLSRAEMDEDQARCLLAAGRVDEARVAAARAGTQLIDPDAMGFANWTAGKPLAPGDLWGRIQGEDEAQSAFSERVARSRGENRSSPEQNNR